MLSEEVEFSSGKGCCRKRLQGAEEKFVVMEKKKCLICNKRHVIYSDDMKVRNSFEIEIEMQL